MHGRGLVDDAPAQQVQGHHRLVVQCVGKAVQRLRSIALILNQFTVLHFYIPEYEVYKEHTSHDGNTDSDSSPGTRVKLGQVCGCGHI